jgi:hypothetical protein
LLRWLFSVRPVQSSYKGENLEIQLVECWVQVGSAREAERFICGIFGCQ